MRKHVFIRNCPDMRTRRVSLRLKLYFWGRECVSNSGIVSSKSFSGVSFSLTDVVRYCSCPSIHPFLGWFFGPSITHELKLQDTLVFTKQKIFTKYPFAVSREQTDQEATSIRQIHSIPKATQPADTLTEMPPIH